MSRSKRPSRKRTSGKQGVSRKRTTLPRDMRPGWLKQGDQRSALYRGMQAQLVELSDQLGGLMNITPMERLLLERAIHVLALIANMEAKMRDGKPIETGSYLACVDRFHSIGKTLGFARRAKPIQSLEQYIETNRGISVQ